jgi:2-oxoacid:acceptor oxidoreductase gamma subunit (pyruvate/2-ketoisovalerate family)
MQAFRIVIAGEGGQGAQSIAKIIAESAFAQGKKAVYVPYFSTEKRGGTTEAYAQVGDTVPAYPKFTKADLWVALSQRAVERIYSYLQDGTKVITNSFLVKDASRIQHWQPIAIDAGRIAVEQLKRPRVANMVMMGAMVKEIPGLDKSSFLDAVKKQFQAKYEKDPSLEALNAKAFEIGYELA